NEQPARAFEAGRTVELPQRRANLGPSGILLLFGQACQHRVERGERLSLEPEACGRRFEPRRRRDDADVDAPESGTAERVLQHPGRAHTERAGLTWRRLLELGPAADDRDWYRDESTFLRRAKGNDCDSPAGPQHAVHIGQ